MFSLRRKYKYLVVSALVAVSFFAALSNFNIINVMFGRAEKRTVNYAEVDKKFDAYPNFKKVQMNFEVQDFKGFDGMLHQIMSGPAQNRLHSLYNDQKPNSYVGIYEIPDSLYEGVYAVLRANPGFRDETVNTLSQQLNISIEENLKNKELQMAALTRKYQEGGNLSENELTRIGDRVDRVQHEVDSLRNLREDYKRNAETNLLYLKVYVSQAGQRSLGEYLKGFLKTFAITFLILTVLFFIIFFAISLTLRLMSYFGIRSSRSSGGYGGYYGRSYGGYGGSSSSRYGGGYGSYGRHRKVKRIYKDRESGEKSGSEKTDNGEQ
jgi:hypothetical protein